MLIALNGRAFVFGKRDLDQYPLDPVFGLEQLGFAGGIGEAEAAAGARHPVRALLEEAVGAVAVPEVVELKRPARGGLAVGDRVAVQQHSIVSTLRAK
ncbi:MAG: hypothetical protein ACLP50_01320 [Solirubrobacteraceae bacterium]